MMSRIQKSIASITLSPTSVIARLRELNSSVLVELKKLETTSTDELYSVVRNKHVVREMVTFFNHKKASLEQKRIILYLLDALVLWGHHGVVAESATVAVLLDAIKHKDPEMILHASSALSNLIDADVNVRELGNSNDDAADVNADAAVTGIYDDTQVRDFIVQSGIITLLLENIKSRRNIELSVASAAALRLFTYSSVTLKTLVHVNGGYDILLAAMKAVASVGTAVASDALIIIASVAVCEEFREEALNNGSFEEAVRWFFLKNEKLSFAALFYFSIVTEFHVEAQAKFFSQPAIVDRLMDLLRTDVGQTGLLCLLSISTYENAKQLLPIVEIEALLGPLFKVKEGEGVGVSEKEGEKKKVTTKKSHVAPVDEMRISTIAAMTLASLIDSDSKTQVLKVDEKLINFIDNSMNATIDGKIWDDPLYTFVRGIANLSVNDDNKSIISKTNIINTLIRVLNLSQDNGEELAMQAESFLKETQEEAAKTIWNLTFNEDCRKKIKSSTEAIETLKRLAVSTKSASLKKNVKGILWSLQITYDKQKNTSTASSGAAVPQPIASATDDEKAPHVMLSYCWAQQPTVKRIATSLKAAGYNVWLDIEQMAGSTLEAMAHAVEQSAVVIVCMSRKYKESPNCRLEGEYTSNLRKPFIPLMMDDDYKPDGWLGIMLGAKLWYDFRTDNSFDSSLAAVLKELSDKAKSSTKGLVISAAPSPSATTPSASPSLTRAEILLWNPEDVAAWLEKGSVAEFVPLFKKHHINGVALLQLSASSANEKIIFRILDKMCDGEKNDATPKLIGFQLQLIFHLRKLPSN